MNKNIEKEISSFGEYNENESKIKKMIDFSRYEKSKKTLFSVKKCCILISSLVVIILGISISVGLINNTSENQTYSVENRRKLAKLVYNSVQINNEEEIPYVIDDINFAKNNNNFIYDQIKVVDSFKFDIKSNCSFDPFFETNLTDKEIEVVIANVGFRMLSNKQEKKWYQTEMIIISFEREIMGFLSPNLCLSNDYNNISDEHYFESCDFITD